MGTVKLILIDGVNEMLSQLNADSVPSSRAVSLLSSHWVTELEFERMIVVWTSVFTLGIIHAQLVMWCIYATTAYVTKCQQLYLFKGYRRGKKNLQLIWNFIKVYMHTLPLPAQVHSGKFAEKLHSSPFTNSI